jgi:ADP-heptose:LPS heptosyltransferase
VSRALLYCAGGGIGDSLLASVVARALRQRFEAVDALTLPGHRDVLERVPDFGDVLVDDGESESELAQRLERRAYDACVVTWATPRTARIPQLAKIPVRVGQARRLYSWRFTHRVPVRSEAGDVTSHWTQILLDYARALNCDTADTAPRLRLLEADEREAQTLLAQLQLNGKPYCIVHATNAIAPERNIWPVSGWTALVRAVTTHFGAAVLLSGANQDSGIVESIAQDSAAIPIAGKIALGGFAALARQAKLFAGITTGSMHVAAAVGAPTVGIFPFQTDTPERWAPLGARTAVVRASFPCRPGERKETCPDYACVANLDVPRIIAASDALLTSR